MSVRISTRTNAPGRKPGCRLHGNRDLDGAARLIHNRADPFNTTLHGSCVVAAEPNRRGLAATNRARILLGKMNVGKERRERAEIEQIVIGSHPLADIDGAQCDKSREGRPELRPRKVELALRDLGFELAIPCV